MDTLRISKNANFSCDICKFKTANKFDYNRHLSTGKHKKEMETLSIIKENALKAQQEECSQCGKIYAYRSGLWKHKQKCLKKETISEIKPMDNALIMKILDQNQELILENKDFKDKLYELASKPTSIVNNVNNKQFNLNIFLNETCKNAMNLSEFVQSLVIRNDEFENMGKLGYVEGISRILIRGLKDLDETKRPMHCTDRKRETVYIKENNVWNKELSREKMKQLVLDVSFKNVRKIPAWKAEHPGCDDTSSNKYMDYVQILNQVMTGIHPDCEGDINKIIRNISHAVVLDKSILCIL
jgi:hypothetical protein